MSQIQQDYARERVEEAPTLMPTWLKRERDAYRDRLLALAEKSYSETGQWFLARGASRVTDEMETKVVWVDLLAFVKLEDLPGYSEENLRKAVAFWRSWQNLKTGQIFNPLYQDPQDPGAKRRTPGNRADYSPEQINMKYVPAILAALGSELPLPLRGLATNVRADAGEDTFDRLWESIALRNPAHAGAFPVEAAESLEAGDEGRIPQIEASMAALLRAYSRETGMWRAEPLPGFPWRDYQPSSGFKIVSRICGFWGMENFPETLVKTAVDNLLEHRSELHDHPSTARNYGETLAHCLAMSGYRSNEALEAMEECLEGFRDPPSGTMRPLWESTASSTYCVFGSGMIGAFMNWEDLPLEQGMTESGRFVHGCTIKWRFVADPLGNWVNVIPKRPEEIAGHPEYDAAIYGLKARHRAHWARRVFEVVPDLVAPGHVPLKHASDHAELSARFTLYLNQGQRDRLVAPHLKASWVGA